MVLQHHAVDDRRRPEGRIYGWSVGSFARNFSRAVAHRQPRGRRGQGQGEARALRRAAPDVAGAEGEADRRWSSPAAVSTRTTSTEFTEAQLNGVPGGPAAGDVRLHQGRRSAGRRSRQDEYRLLVTAEKSQTGFDQPLLCAMYVDKPLTGVTAAQTLSRLNRIHPLKAQDDVHILDFVNQATDIQTAFEDWFETTITEPSDPNLLYDKQREAMGLRTAGRVGGGGVHPGPRWRRTGADAGRGGTQAARAAARVPQARAGPFRRPRHRRPARRLPQCPAGLRPRPQPHRADRRLG